MLEKTAPPIERPVAGQKMTVEEVSRLPQGYADFSPDLAVEIVSPNDRLIDIEEKVQLHLSNGTRLMWVINPRQRSATIYHSDRTARLLRADDVLDGEDVLPGFTCRLTDIL